MVAEVNVTVSTAEVFISVHKGNIIFPLFYTYSCPKTRALPSAVRTAATSRLACTWPSGGNFMHFQEGEFFIFTNTESMSWASSCRIVFHLRRRTFQYIFFIFSFRLVILPGMDWIEYWVPLPWMSFLIFSFLQSRLFIRFLSYFKKGYNTCKALWGLQLNLSHSCGHIARPS